MIYLNGRELLKIAFKFFAFLKILKLVQLGLVNYIALEVFEVVVDPLLHLGLVRCNGRCLSNRLIVIELVITTLI